MSNKASHHLLIVTTAADRSAVLLQQAAEALGITVTTHQLHEPGIETILEQLKNGEFTLFYLRDPFNTKTFDFSYLQSTIEQLFAVVPPITVVVDRLTSFDDVLFEDKWQQYQRFSEFMPATALLSDTDDVTADTNMVKKRISSRSRGIIFSPEQLVGRLDNYIIQDAVPIEREFRVFAVGGVIEPTIAVRTSKTKDTKMKMAGIETISPALQNFAETIVGSLSYDLTGLDIVESPAGLYLLEVNRSPQFNTFQMRSGIPIAEQLLAHLVK